MCRGWCLGCRRGARCDAAGVIAAFAGIVFFALLYRNQQAGSSRSASIAVDSRHMIEAAGHWGGKLGGR